MVVARLLASNCTPRFWLSVLDCERLQQTTHTGRERDRELHRYYDNVNNNDCYCYFGITTNWDYGSDYSIKASIVVVVVIVAHKPCILVGSH